MGKKSNYACFVQWLKSKPNIDTKKDGLKARIEDSIQKNTISKTEKKYITDLL